MALLMSKETFSGRRICKFHSGSGAGRCRHGDHAPPRGPEAKDDEQI